MQIKYGFTINRHVVTPITSSSLAKVYALENGQQFYRANLSGNITLIKEDYTWLNAQSFGTEFVLIMYRLIDGRWENYYKGRFFKTDCTWNDDDMTVVIKPTIYDQYTTLLSGISNEYNLIKLQPEITHLEVQKRPMIQAYSPGSNVVSCFFAGMYWEEEVTTSVDSASALINTYKFALATYIDKISVTGVGTPDVAGDYVSTDGITYVNGDYKIIKIKTTAVLGHNTLIYTQLSLQNTSSEEFFVTGKYTNRGYEYKGEYKLVPVGSSTGELIGFSNSVNIYTRYLTDVNEINGMATSKLPADDIVADNRNYSRVLSYAFDATIMSRATQLTATEFGLADNDEYFTEYAPAYQGKYFPVARSTWGYTSLWFKASVWPLDLEIAGRKALVVKDSYSISDVIKVLVKKIDNTLTHEGTKEYSQFLYSDTSPISSDAFTLMLTQKSNILAGDYDTAAQKMPITLQTVMSMLRVIYHCYWFIEGNKFKIEHISYFRKGGSYTNDNTYTADLTALLNPKNKKTWDFNSNKYSYDTQELAERIQFSWMDDCSTGFEGVPIEVVSPYVKDGKIESVEAGSFTSDIDYMLLNPSNISPDGFALFAAIDAPNLFATYSIGTANKYINGSTGLEITSTSYNISEYIQVTEATKYRLNILYQTGAAVSNAWVVAFYSSDKTYLSSTGYDYNTSKKIITPLTTAYIRISADINYWYNIEFSKSIKVLPFIERYIDGSFLNMQNGLLSMTYIPLNYWMHDLPAKSVKINNTLYPATGIIRSKKQSVEYPSISDPNPIQLIKTSLGDGKIEKISVNLQSRMNKVTLAYDTE